MTAPIFLLVVCGLPGTGKSQLAEALGRALKAPVFAKDWLEAVIRSAGLQAGEHPGSSPGWVAYELLTVLAERQLSLGQSAILDSVAATVSIRARWRSLAAEYSAAWRVVECVCSDEALHRARLSGRQRGIPGWHELEWSEVERVRSYYVPWDEPRLALDAVRPFEENLREAMRYVEG